MVYCQWVTRFFLNCILVVLNVTELSWALADLHVCRMILPYLNCLLGDYRFLLNCLLLTLNVAELSQALTELYAG